LEDARSAPSFSADRGDVLAPYLMLPTCVRYDDGERVKRRGKEGRREGGKEGRR